MPTIQEYLEAARGDIISGACDRAILLCRYLLQHYPKHLEAHCLLAEAYREKGDDSGAEELFLRVLSSDPESLIARWALSIIHDDRGQAEIALAHLRLALEINPDHNELRKEVVRRSDDRAKLTQAGLARLYLRAGVFDRAGAEFRAALAREPKRLDLLVGLAEALWRGWRMDEAAAVCRRALEESPDCLKAQLISAMVEAARGKPLGEAEASLWEGAHALDPENCLVGELAAAANLTLPDDRLALIPTASELPEPVAPSAETSAQAETTSPAYAGHLASEAEEGAATPWSPGAALTADEQDAFERRMAELARLIAKPAGETAPWPEPAPAGDWRDENREIAQPASPELPLTPSEPAAPEIAEPGAEDLPPALTPDQPAPVPAPARVETPGPANWGEWADLLSEEIALDPEAESRLNAALADIQLPSEQPGEQRRFGSGGDAGETSRPGTGAERSAAFAAPNGVSDPAESLSLAKAHAAAGQFEDAVSEFATLLKTAPSLASDIAGGLRDVVRDAPNYADAHRTLGDAYMKLGQFQQAIDEYSLALNLKVDR